MKTSPTISKIVEALCEAQKNFGSIIKDKLNPHFKSKYADLGNVLDAVKKPLLDAGLVLVQTMNRDGSVNFLETTLYHKSGEFFQTEMVMPGFSKAQELGSGLSYVRRYSLMALLGIAADDDDDGNKANEKPMPKKHESLEVVSSEEYKELLHMLKEKGIENEVKTFLKNTYNIFDLKACPKTVFERVKVSGGAK